ncbi:Receptor kinase TMK4 [Spatholobus suberectus]|nr:Receptor kinase TMK4 [Spatholobus suberectus]
MRLRRSVLCVLGTVQQCGSCSRSFDGSPNSTISPSKTTHFSSLLPSLVNLSVLRIANLNHNNFTSFLVIGLTSLQTLNLGSAPTLALPPGPSPPTSPFRQTSTTSTLAPRASLVPCRISSTNSLPLKTFASPYNNLISNLPTSLITFAIVMLWLNNQAIELFDTLHVFFNMTKLYQAWLCKNQFTSSIPDLSQCKSLFDLQLRDN